MDRTPDSSTQLKWEELRKLDGWFDERLKEIYTREKPGNQSGWSIISRWFVRGLLFLFCCTLPFFVLIRISMLTYSRYALDGWLALGSGVVATIFLCLLYGVWLSVKLGGRAKINRHMMHVAAGLVLVFCCYGLLYISSLNVKEGEMRTYYRSLHPILRITLATATLADPDLIITGMQRTPGDYSGMGLESPDWSLHYVQSTGYVHAVDLRTIGRSAWKNRLTHHLLQVAGYRVIRHVGSADHLHVSLPLND